MIFFLQNWYTIKTELQNLLIEANDNVRFLSAIEHSLEPLYRCKPSEITAHLPILMTKCREIFITSSFFNTNEKITSFFSKLTNQLIVSSQKYITNDRQITIWRESKHVLLQKIDDCLNMQNTYRRSFEKMIEDMKNNNELILECSRSFLFDRLDLFNDRLIKICKIMETDLNYRIITNYDVGGMEKISVNIKASFEKISKTLYDPLMYRDIQFEKDFCIFRKEIIEVEKQIEEFVIDCLKEAESVDQKILILKKIEKLNLNSTRIVDRCLDTIKLLRTEIEELKDKYNEERGKPPIPLGFPPCGGRITWVRSLRKKIYDPLCYLTRHECTRKFKITQECVQIYNILAPIFQEFESSNYKAWFDYVSQVRIKLEIPILRKNTSNRYEINLDPYVIQAIKETECMLKFGLPIPSLCRTLYYCKDHVIDSYNIIKELIRRNDQLRLSIYPMFLPLMRIHLAKLERIFAPALTQITWLAFDINKYFVEVSRVLDPAEQLVKDVSDINDAQIEKRLQQIEDYMLVYLPEEPLEPNKLKELNVKYREEIVPKMEIKSLAAEKASVDLINTFIEKADSIPLYDDSGKFQCPPSMLNDNNWRYEVIKPIDKYDWVSFDKIYKAVGYASPEDNEKLVFEDYSGLIYDVSQLHIDCMELFAYYNHRMIAALVKSTKRSMEFLRTRSNLIYNITSYDCATKTQIPIFSVSVELRYPDFVMIPNINQIQEIYYDILMNLAETHQGISTWGKQAKTEERKNRPNLLSENQHEKNWFNTIKNHKDVVRYRLTFDNVVLYLQPEIDKMLEAFKNDYQYLWSDDREKVIEDFVQSIPLAADIRDKMIQYDSITDTICKLEPKFCISLIQVNREKMIAGLIEESKAWKSILGRKLCAFYQIILQENVEFISDQNKILSRGLEDLDDCRVAMECLKVIRERFIDIDQSLGLMEHTYALFQEFELNVPNEDLERVDGLRFEFDKMIEKSKSVGATIVRMQQSLLEELQAGVSKFQYEIKTFDQNFINEGPMVEGIPAKEASDRVLLFSAKLDDLLYKQETFSSGEQLFGLPINEYPILQKRKRDINYLNRLYKLYLDVMYTVDEYFDLPFSDVDMEKINVEIQEFVNRCRVLPKAMKNWTAFIDLRQKIDDFYECCPLIELMASNAMKPRHWEQLQNKLNYIFNTEDENFTLGYVLKAPLVKFKEEIEEICVGAAKEQDIEVKLQTVIREWKDVEMPLAVFKNRGELLIKASDVTDIITKLEDSLMIMSSLASNRFNGPFKKDIMLWLKNLSDTTEILERWLQVQSLWMYLEAVFVGGDIARQLPQEAKRFGNIDKEWVRIMYKTRDTMKIIEICKGDDTITNSLTFLTEQLELCQKSLTVYLETKRLIFPRFFFISDPVLLEILGQASDPSSIQPHLLSLFDGVARVEFEKEKGTKIIAMLSSNGERIDVSAPVQCIGLVENWIGKLLESVLDTMKDILGNVGMKINDSKFDYKTQLSLYCAQAQMICIQLIWTKDVEYALSNCVNDRRIMKIKNLETQDMLDFLVDQTVKDLTKLERICSETLVTIHVHQRDIFDDLARLKIKSPQDFEWQKQSRFYYDSNLEKILVRITDVDFIYQNEYLGVTERLAITPLTDRCYITLAQAIGMHMGGAPAG